MPYTSLAFLFFLVSQDGKEQLGSKCENTLMEGESESETLGFKGKGLFLGKG